MKKLLAILPVLFVTVSAHALTVEAAKNELKTLSKKQFQADISITKDEDVDKTAVFIKCGPVDQCLVKYYPSVQEAQARFFKADTRWSDVSIAEGGICGTGGGPTWVIEVQVKKDNGAWKTVRTYGIAANITSTLELQSDMQCSANK